MPKFFEMAAKSAPPPPPKSGLPSVAAATPKAGGGLVGGVNSSSSGSAGLEKKTRDEVFESADEPEVSSVKPKELGKSASSASKPEEKKDDAGVVVQTDIKPQLAFEVFAGKVYGPRPANLDLPALHEVVEHSHVPTKERHFESPLERFNRLRAEVTQFQSDLSALAQSAEKNKVLSGVSGRIADELVKLEQEILGLSKSKSFSPLLQKDVSSEFSAEQKGLLDKLAADLEKLSKDKGKVPPPPASGNLSAPAPAGASGGVVYEVFYNPTKDSGRQQVAVSSLDKRVATMEKALGNIDATKTLGYPDVCSALQYMQRRLEVLDATKLDAINRRIRTLMSELDALQAAKGRAAQQSEGLPPAHVDKVNALYEVMMRWDPTSKQLPALVARLQTLKDLHEESAAAVVRIQNYNSDVAELERLLKLDLEALHKMETSLTTNLKTMQANSKALETRFSELAAKIDKLGSK